jgi:hypothetical protein
MATKLMARLVFDSDSYPDLAAEELSNAGYRMHRMSDGDLRRYHLLDDHIEAVIAGSPTRRSLMQSDARSKTSYAPTVAFCLRSARSTAVTSRLSGKPCRFFERTNLEYSYSGIFCQLICGMGPINRSLKKLNRAGR